MPGRLLHLLAGACLVGALLSAGLLGVPASAHPEVPQAGNGLNATAVAKLWAGDVDGNQSVNGSAKGSIALTEQTDWVWSRPPNQPATWNRNEFTSFADSFEPNRSTSVHPTGADLADSPRGLITDAHATRFGLQPATRAHVNDSETRVYVKPEGTVRGLVDYRIREPTTSAAGRTVSWELERHEIAAVCLVQDRERIESAPRPCSGPGVIGSGGGSTPSFAYETNGVGTRTTRLTFVARIQATFTKTVVQNATQTDQTCQQERSGNQTRMVCSTTGSTTTDRTQTTVREQVVVTDALPSVTVYGVRSPVQFATYPNGDTGIALQLSTLWSGLSLNGQQVFGTAWRFYSHRDPQWDTFVTESATGATTAPSPAHPVRVMAFPSAFGHTGPRGQVDGRPVHLVSQTAGKAHSGPASQVPDTVDADVTQDAYRPTRTIVLRYPGTPTAVDLDGLVRNAGITRVLTTDRAALQRSSLDLTVVARNRTHATVHLTLQGRDSGKPIDLSGRSGSIRIQGATVNTNATGEVEVTVPYSGGVQATYRPTPWWQTSAQAYTGTTERAVVESPLFTISALAALATRLLLVSLPIGVALYLCDQLPGVRAWPPWRLIR